MCPVLEPLHLLQAGLRALLLGKGSLLQRVGPAGAALTLPHAHLTAEHSLHKCKLYLNSRTRPA